MIKLKLAHRGTLLVIFPLLCQLIFVALLVPKVWKAQAEVTQRARARQTLMNTHQLIWQTMQTVGYIINYSQLKDEMSIDQLLKSVEDAKAKLEQTLEQVELEPQQQQRCAHLRQSALKLYSLCEQVLVAIRRDGPAAVPDLRRSIAHRAPLFSDELSDLAISEEPQTKSNLPEVESGLISFFGAALLISAAVALLLGYLYVVGIKRPISQITENSMLLSKGGKLLPPLKGNDELAVLDRLFHSVADSVNAASAKERAVVDNAMELICSLDQNGVFTAANRFSQKMVGLSSEEIIGRSLFEFLLPGDAASADEKLTHACQSVQTEVFELRLRSVDGQVIDTRWSCFWVSSRNNLFCVAADVTEEKNIQRLKEDFVNMISHDLRSPLMSMHGAMTLIAEGPPEELQAPALQEVLAAANNIDKLVAFVNDLLDFQRLKEGKMPLALQDCNMLEIVEEAVDMLQNLSQSKNVAISINSGYWRVTCDRQKVLQTIMNLLANAIKFSPSDGVVAVEVGETEEAIQVLVQDQGPGVPAEMQQRIFDAFEQVSSPKSKEGTGLGLAICKLIVEAHGGQIGVRSREGEERGSMFWFKLPKQALEAKPGVGLR
jgi:PAS domain S-box-containing protein